MVGIDVSSRVALILPVVGKSVSWLDAANLLGLKKESDKMVFKSS
jgi:hypothetical protein